MKHFGCSVALEGDNSRKLFIQALVQVIRQEAFSKRRIRFIIKICVHCRNDNSLFIFQNYWGGGGEGRIPPNPSPCSAVPDTKSKSRFHTDLARFE